MSERDTAETEATPTDEVEVESGAEAETPDTEGEPVLSEVEQYITALEGELRDVTAKLRTVSAAYVKLQEEFGGFRERQARLNESKRELLKGDTVTRLFEPLENLRRSIDALLKGGLEPEAAGGLEMVYRDFLAGFNDLGLQEINPEGLPFDPDLHEALSTLPVTDAGLDGVVVQVFNTGYRVGSRLIRPARVIIGQHHDEAAGEA